MKILKKITSSLTNASGWFKGLSLRKKLFFIGVFLIVLLVIISQISQLRKPPPYTVEIVEKSDIVETVSESGNIISSGTTQIFSPSNGITTEIFVENGQQVKEGEKLLVVKSSATQQEEKQAQANYLAAVSALNAAQSTANTLRAAMYSQWDSFRGLATNSTYENGDDSPNTEKREAAEFQISQDQWLAAEKKYKDQQTAIAQAQAAVESAKSLYMATQNAIVTAPVSGIVNNLAVTKGSPVAIKSMSLTGTSSTPALLIVSDYTSEILILLSETDSVKVKSGQESTIEINALSNKKFKGKVARVDTIGTDNEGIIKYKAYISLLESGVDVKQGMTVDVEIITNKIDDALSVSNSAVKPYQGGKAVRVPDNSKPEKFSYIPVITGIKGKERTQILKGLSEGQKVIKVMANEGIKRRGLFGN